MVEKVMNSRSRQEVVSAAIAVHGTYYGEVLGGIMLHKLVTLRHGWVINVDIEPMHFYHIAVVMHDRQHLLPVRWIDIDDPRSIRESLNEEVAWLENLGLTRVNHVQPHIYVGDIVQKTGGGIRWTVREVRRIRSEATPHGYTYVLDCTGYEGWGKNFLVTFNYNRVEVVGNLKEGLFDEVPVNHDN